MKRRENALMGVFFCLKALMHDWVVMGCLERKRCVRVMLCVETGAGCGYAAMRLCGYAVLRCCVDVT